MDYDDALRSEKSERLPSWKWEEIRQEILKRDHYVCCNCGAEGKEVDHIIPKGLGGTDDKENLQTLCVCCHLKKTKQDQERIRRAKKIKKYERRIRRRD